MVPSAIHLTPSMEVSGLMRINDGSDAIDYSEGFMILSTRLHTLEATLSSMTLRVLNLVQVRS